MAACSASGSNALLWMKFAKELLKVPQLLIRQAGQVEPVPRLHRHLATVPDRSLAADLLALCAFPAAQPLDLNAAFGALPRSWA